MMTKFYDSDGEEEKLLKRTVMSAHVSKTHMTKENEDVAKYGYGVRHIQLMIFTICFIVCYIARGHMGVTIVAMTNDPEENIACMNTIVDLRTINERNDLIDPNYDDNNISTKESNESVDFVDTTQSTAKTYDWPKAKQEIVLSSFFAGYTIMMFPVGIFCQRVGGKLPLQVGLLVNGIVSMVTPWLTLWGGWKALSFCRFLQGLSQAGTYPSIQELLARWVPVCERATFTSYIYTGISLGNIIGFQMAGFLGDSRFGWPSTFWAVGVICLICFLALTVFGAATPLEHKTISQAEKQFILGDTDEESSRKLRIPWRAILTSLPMWGLTATHVGSSVTFVFFFIQVPSYIHNILGISVKRSAILSSLPYIASLFSCLAFGRISDYCTNNKLISIKNARRLFNSISQCGIALALICVSYTRNTTFAVTCLVLAMVCHMAVYTGWAVNLLDLAPNFAGILTAAGNTLANILNIFVTILVTFVITDMTNVEQWRIMFFIVAALCLVTNAIFVILISSEVQPWNFAGYNETSVEDPKLQNTKT